MIAITRKRVIGAAQELQRDGKVPATVDNPDIYRGARGGSCIASAKLDWLEAYALNLRQAKSPLGLLARMAEAAE
jgi:hypothetical protein